MELYFKFNKWNKKWDLNYLLEEKDFLAYFLSYQDKYLEDFDLNIEEESEFVRFTIENFTHKCSELTLFNETLASYLFSRMNESLENSLIFPHHDKVHELIKVLERYPEFTKGLFFIEQNGEIVVTSTDLSIIFSIIESFLETICC